MERRRDAMVRLGAPRLCERCTRPLLETGRRTPAELETPRVCRECQEGDRSKAIQQIQNRVDRRLAVHDTARLGDGSYQQACEAMQDDVAAALEDWPMGNGVVGPRY